MKGILLAYLILISPNILAFNCDCELIAYHPLTSSYKVEPKVIKKFEIEAFGSFSKKNIESCRKLCSEEFEDKVSPKILNRMLIEYSSRLVEEGLLGYSCTSLTQIKYPLRVKAYLGGKSIGISSDFVQVIHSDQKCF